MRARMFIVLALLLGLAIGAVPTAGWACAPNSPFKVMAEKKQARVTLDVDTANNLLSSALLPEHLAQQQYASEYSMGLAALRNGQCRNGIRDLSKADQTIRSMHAWTYVE